jgi:hypothetical protein
MAFTKDNSNHVISFAEYADVVTMDARVFESNEGLSQSVINDFLVRSTGRILSLIRDTDWWRDMYIKKTPGSNYTSDTDLPQVNLNRILARQQDFTELTCMYALWNYILPRVADFSKEDNAERAKIGFYQGKYQFLFDEIVNGGDWYDLSGDGIVQSTEKMTGNNTIKRIR